MQFPILKTKIKHKLLPNDTQGHIYEKNYSRFLASVLRPLHRSGHACARKRGSAYPRKRHGTPGIHRAAKSMTYPLDSLLNDWKAKNYIDLGKDCSTSTVNPMFSDSVYIDRLSRMPTVMEMPYNEIVRKFIDMYAGRLRNQVAFMLSACNFYMPRSAGCLRPAARAEIPAHHRIRSQPFCRIPRGSLRTMAVYARHRKDIRTGKQQPRRRTP